MGVGVSATASSEQTLEDRAVFELVSSSLIDSNIPFLNSEQRKPRTLELTLDSEATSSLPMPESTVSEAVALNRPPRKDPSSGASLSEPPPSIVSNVRVLRSLTVERDGRWGEVGEDDDADGEKSRVSATAGSAAEGRQATVSSGAETGSPASDS